MSTKQPINDIQLDWFAQQLESYAAKYREMAKLVRDHELNAVDMTGWKTLEEKVLFHLSGHSSRARVTVDRAVDSKTLGSCPQSIEPDND